MSRVGQARVASSPRAPSGSMLRAGGRHLSPASGGGAEDRGSARVSSLPRRPRSASARLASRLDADRTEVVVLLTLLALALAEVLGLGSARLGWVGDATEAACRGHAQARRMLARAGSARLGERGGCRMWRERERSGGPYAAGQVLGGGGRCGRTVEPRCGSARTRGEQWWGDRSHGGQRRIDRFLAACSKHPRPCASTPCRGLARAGARGAAAPFPAPPPPASCNAVVLRRQVDRRSVPTCGQCWHGARLGRVRLGRGALRGGAVESAVPSGVCSERAGRHSLHAWARDSGRSGCLGLQACKCAHHCVCVSW